MQIQYRKNDVWLCEYGGEMEFLTILEIAGRHLRHNYGWEHVDAFHERTKEKIGRARRFLGIHLWTVRE